MLTYPFPDAPVPGQFIQVAPNVQWLRMPLPFALNHINLWVLEDCDSVTLIDTGIDTEITRNTWREIFAGLLKGKKIDRLICTHFHPDHMGLAGWLMRDYGIPVHMTHGEYEAAKLWHGQRNDAFIDKLMAYLVQGGIDPDVAKTAASQRGKIPSLVSTTPDTVTEILPEAPIHAGGTEWNVIIGEGHAPQLVTLYSAERNVLISSDQILPQISPNISVSLFTPDADPLKLYMTGMEKFLKLPEDTLVLPSHRMPFKGLHQRAQALVAHHEDRLRAAVEACTSEVTAYNVMLKLFPRVLDAHQTFFALGETLAHLNYLIGQGTVIRATRADGAWLYKSVA